jgi:glycosyl transferase, family 25
VVAALFRLTAWCAMLRAFVINLDRSTDRLAHMRAELAQVGAHFERIRAVDGRSVPPDLRPQFLDGNGNPLGRLGDGEIGCYASHLTVHQRVVAERLKCALVLEDDVRLMPHLLEIAQAAIAAAPAAWDLIHLSSVIKRAVYAVANLPHDHHLIRYVRAPRNTAGYLISSSGATKMLKPAPRTRTVDIDMKRAYERDLEVLGVHPSPVMWGDHLPSTMVNASGWNVPSSRADALQGFVYAVRKLGIAGSVRCSLANLRLALERLAGRRPQAIPVVKSRRQRGA